MEVWRACAGRAKQAPPTRIGQTEVMPLKA
jgi:hypothetical protein